jgi:uncharacterized protein
MKQLKFIVFLLFAFLQVNLFAQSEKYHDAIPNVPSTPALVNDLADMLTPEEELKLESKLETFNNETSNEIAVITVDTLGGLEVSEFANELGRKWDIGKEKRKNGVILLVSKKDRKVNISPGYGLQGALPDVICSRIIRENIVSNFRAGNVFAGFDEATDNIIAATKGEFTNDEYAQGDGISLFTLLFIIIIFGIIFMAIMYSLRNKKNIYVSRRGYHYDDDDWTPRGGGLFGGGFGGFSGGSDNDSGGGFGGFGGGGGGFDGGGASGSW